MLISSNNFLKKSLVFPLYRVMSFVNKDNLSSSFPIGIYFITFSCLIVLARTYSALLNRSDKRGHASFILDLMSIEYYVSCSSFY
jgi:hypothetical protein